MPPADTFVIPVVSVPTLATGTLFQEIGQKLLDIYPYLVTYAKGAVSLLVVISIPLSVFFIIGIIYCVEKLKIIRIKEKLKHDVKVELPFEAVKTNGNADLTVRWRKVNNLLNSSNQNDWKQAILEADNMLLDILTGLGYQGEGVGEKLKRVMPGEFKSIEDAWEAHKIRNGIAHDGAYALTHHDAVQTIHRFRRVFEEFYYI